MVCPVSDGEVSRKAPRKAFGEASRKVFGDDVGRETSCRMRGGASLGAHPLYGRVPPPAHGLLWDAPVRNAGFSLIGAIIALAVLSGIGLLMMTIAVNFDRLARESRHGAQLEMVLDALLLNYRYRGAQGHDHGFYHITLDGMMRVPGPDAPAPERWLDTIEVDIWDEPLPGGKRIWGTARSSFSRRAATLLQYVPETTGG